MVSTFPLLAASLLLGQVPDVPPGSAAPPSGKVYVYNNGQLVPYSDAQRSGLFSPPAGTVTSEPRRPFLSRLQGWFKRTKNDAGNINTIETAPPPLIGPSPSPGQGSTLSPTMPPAVSPPAPGDYPRKMPMSIKSPTTTSPTSTTVPTTSNTGHTIPASEALSPVALKALPTAVKTPILPANINRIGRDEKFEWVTGQLEMEKGQYVLYYATPETVDPHQGRIILNPNRVDLHGFHSGDLISVHGRLSTGRTSAVYHVTSADLIERAKK